MASVFDNYECDGQMELSDYLKDFEKMENYTRKPLIYHMSLTRYYYECPYCKAENSTAHSEKGTYCSSCNKYFDGVIERKSKDLIEVEKQLGSGGGAVYKDEKGNWHYSDI